MRTYLKRALWGTLIARGHHAPRCDGRQRGRDIRRRRTALRHAGGDSDLGTDLGGPAMRSPCSATTSSRRPHQHRHRHPHLHLHLHQRPAPAPAPAAETSGSSGTASGTQAVVTVNVPVSVSGQRGERARRQLIDQRPGRNSPELGSPGRGTDRGASRDHERRGRRALGARRHCSRSTRRSPSRTTPVSLLGDSESAATSGEGAAAPASSAPAASGSTGLRAAEDGGIGPEVRPIPAWTVGRIVLASRLAGPLDRFRHGRHRGHVAPRTTGGTSGDDAILGGTQAVAPVTAPVTVSGNAISLLGDSAGDRNRHRRHLGADRTRDRRQHHHRNRRHPRRHPDHRTHHRPRGRDRQRDLRPRRRHVTGTGGTTAAPTAPTTGGNHTTGTDGILGGTQLGLPVTLPDHDRRERHLGGRRGDGDQPRSRNGPGD